MSGIKVSIIYVCSAQDVKVSKAAALWIVWTPWLIRKYIALSLGDQELADEMIELKSLRDTPDQLFEELKLAP